MPDCLHDRLGRCHFRPIATREHPGQRDHLTLPFHTKHIKIIMQPRPLARQLPLHLLLVIAAKPPRNPQGSPGRHIQGRQGHDPQLAEAGLHPQLLVGFDELS